MDIEEQEKAAVAAVKCAVFGPEIVRLPITMDLCVASFYQACRVLEAFGEQVILRAPEWAVRIVAEINRDRQACSLQNIRYEIKQPRNDRSYGLWEVEVIGGNKKLVSGDW